MKRNTQICFYDVSQIYGPLHSYEWPIYTKITSFVCLKLSFF